MNHSIVYDRILGPAAPQLGWVPAPRYLLRRARILNSLENIAPCRVLEIGCGPGMLLHEIGLRGFQCTALESSAAALSIAKKIAADTGSSTEFLSDPGADWAGKFQLVMAFEVLEHIEADEAVLADWTSWLAPGGTLLLSVPAHQDRWNARDVWAGHVRRYERADLVSKVRQAGLELESIECYGFPLANFLERAGDRRYKVDADGVADAAARDINTANSGIDRSRDAGWFPLLRSLPGKTAMQLAILLQAPFLRTEWGNGYIVRARKPA